MGAKISVYLIYFLSILYCYYFCTMIKSIAIFVKFTWKAWFLMFMYMHFKQLNYASIIIWYRISYRFLHKNLLITRGLSPPARYRLPTPGNRLRGSHLDRFTICARFARSPWYDSRAKITRRFKLGIWLIVYHPFSPS